MLTAENLPTMLTLLHEAASQSPDPWKKVGAVGLVAGRVAIASYNVASPPHPSFWQDREARRPFMIHAEQMLIAERRLEPIDTVLITLLPCVSCMNLLAAAGVKEVYYEEAYPKDEFAFQVARFHGINCYNIKDITK